LGVPDDIGRIQGIPAVKKVENHWSNTTFLGSPEVSTPSRTSTGSTTFAHWVRVTDRLTDRHPAASTAIVSNSCIWRLFRNEQYWVVQRIRSLLKWYALYKFTFYLLTYLLTATGLGVQYTINKLSVVTWRTSVKVLRRKFYHRRTHHIQLQLKRSTGSQRHLSKAVPNDPAHTAYTARAAADLSHATDRQTDRQTPWTSVRIVSISCFRCSPIIKRLQNWFTSDKVKVEHRNSRFRRRQHLPPAGPLWHCKVSLK